MRLLMPSALLALCAPFASALSVQFEARVQLNGPGLFPGSAGGTLNLPMLSYQGDLGLTAGLSDSQALPPSAVEAGGRAAASDAPATLRQDVYVGMENGSFYLTNKREHAAFQAPLRDPSAPQPLTSRQPGLNAVVGGPGGMTLTPNAPAEAVTAESTPESLAKKAGPLAEALFRANAESARLESNGEFYDKSLKRAVATFDVSYANNGLVQDRSVQETVHDAAAPRLLLEELPLSSPKPFTDDVDRNSVLPFSRALVRYGLEPAQVRDIVQEYLNIHGGESGEGYHGLLLGIRSANLMAQYLAANEPYRRVSAPGTSWSEAYHTEQTTNDRIDKQALILAALLHRTDLRAKKNRAVPTAEEAAFYVASANSSSRMSELLRAMHIHQDDMGMWVGALIGATNYRNFDTRQHREAAVDALAGALNFHTVADYSRARAVKLGSILQLVTRAAMFTDGTAFAEAAVRARAAEERAASRSEHPTDDEALRQAVAELRDITSGHMPIMADGDRTRSLPGGTATANFYAASRHFLALLADGINSRRVPVAFSVLQTRP